MFPERLSCGCISHGSLFPLWDLFRWLLEQKPTWALPTCVLKRTAAPLPKKHVLKRTWEIIVTGSQCFTDFQGCLKGSYPFQGSFLAKVGIQQSIFLRENIEKATGNASCFFLQRLSWGIAPFFKGSKT